MSQSRVKQVKRKQRNSSDGFLVLVKYFGNLIGCKTQLNLTHKILEQQLICYFLSNSFIFSAAVVSQPVKHSSGNLMIIGLVKTS